MKKPGKKFYFHFSIVALLVIAAISGWVNLFYIVNLLYALFWAVKIVRCGIRNSVGKWRKIIEATALSIGASFLVPFMLIPGWLVAVTYMTRNPDIGENVPEYKFFNVILKDATFINSYNYRSCEGFLSEDDLKLLAVNRGWKLENITKPQTIRNTAGNLIEQHRSEKYEPTPVTVKNGYSYSTYNGTDSGIMYTWCRDSSKFYFFSSLR